MGERGPASAADPGAIFDRPVRVDPRHAGQLATTRRFRSVVRLHPVYGGQLATTWRSLGPRARRRPPPLRGAHTRRGRQTTPADGDPGRRAARVPRLRAPLPVLVPHGHGRQLGGAARVRRPARTAAGVVPGRPLRPPAARARSRSGAGRRGGRHGRAAGTDARAARGAGPAARAVALRRRLAARRRRAGGAALPARGARGGRRAARGGEVDARGAGCRPSARPGARARRRPGERGRGVGRRPAAPARRGGGGARRRLRRGGGHDRAGGRAPARARRGGGRGGRRGASRPRGRHPGGVPGRARGAAGPADPGRLARASAPGVGRAPSRPWKRRAPQGISTRWWSPTAPR